jgi:hypothetical protein
MILDSGFWIFDSWPLTLGIPARPPRSIQNPKSQIQNAFTRARLTAAFNPQFETNDPQLEYSHG